MALDDTGIEADVDADAGAGALLCCPFSDDVGAVEVGCALAEVVAVVVGGWEAAVDADASCAPPGGASLDDDAVVTAAGGVSGTVAEVDGVGAASDCADGAGGGSGGVCSCVCAGADDEDGCEEGPGIGAGAALVGIGVGADCGCDEVAV